MEFYSAKSTSSDLRLFGEYRKRTGYINVSVYKDYFK